PYFDSIEPIPQQSPSVQDPSRASKRDSVRNGLIIGAAVAAALSIFGTQIADCPDGKESCAGTKALGIGFTIAAGAAIGAGIDLLFEVNHAPSTLKPARIRQH